MLYYLPAALFWHSVKFAFPQMYLWMPLCIDYHFHQQRAKVFHTVSHCQAGEWGERCLPAVPPLWRCGGWKGFWVRLLKEEDERVGQADSNPPGVAAAGDQWRGGQPHTAQTATGGEGLPSWDTHLNDEYYPQLYYISWLVIPWRRCSWSGSQRFCRERFYLYVSRRISQELPSATSLSERTSTVSNMFGWEGLATLGYNNFKYCQIHW